MVQCSFMLLLHLSDFHLSRYGESGTWKHPKPKHETKWEPIHVWQRWQIQGLRDRRGRPDRLRLVDPEGVLHKVKNWPARKSDRAISSLLAMAMKRHLTSAELLVKNRPTPEDLAAMLHVDSLNTNLRFLKMVDAVKALGPDVILMTGDITENGFGYGLVRHYLRPWIENHRLFTIAGNHDTYDIIPRLGRRARTEVKEERYNQFAGHIGMEPNPTGAWVRRMNDVALVGLNSCKMPRTPLSASGAVSREQLSWLRELGRDSAFRDARLRLGLVHHHLLRIPFAVGKRSPIEVGMRLRNAVEVMRTCTDASLDMIFNGHRHHGYMVQLPGRPTVISAPSSTLGCKSIFKVYGWIMDLDDEHPFPLLHELFEDPC